MKTKLIGVFFIFISILTSCNKKVGEPNPDGTTGQPSKNSRSFSGEWVANKGGAGGIQNPESFKNFQLEYEIENNNQAIKYELSSTDLDVSFFLYDANGSRLFNSTTGRNVSDEKTLNEGKYRIVVMAERNGLGKFSLKITGIKKEIVKIVSKALNSKEKAWSDQGGGGLYGTYRNHIYTFDVTENNAYVDIEMESKDTEIGLYLFDQIQVLEQATGRRSHYVLGKLNKGTYSIMTATAVRGTKGKYTMNVYGKVDNLKQVESQEKVINGNWENGRVVDKYKFEVTENNTAFDVELSSPAYQIAFAIVNERGVVVGGPQYGGGNSEFSIVRLQSGSYEVYVYPANTYSGSGNYKLAVFGKFR
jgi:hypothetical protein